MTGPRPDDRVSASSKRWPSASHPVQPVIGERKAFERVHSLTGQVFFLFVFVSVGQLMDAIDRYRSHPATKCHKIQRKLFTFDFVGTRGWVHRN